MVRVSVMEEAPERAGNPTKTEQTELSKIIKNYRERLSLLASFANLDIVSVQENGEIKDAMLDIVDPMINLEVSRALGQILPPHLLKIQDHEFKNLVNHIMFLSAIEFCDNESDKEKYFKLGYDSILPSINYLDLLTNSDKRQNISLDDLKATFPKYLLENVNITQNVNNYFLHEGAEGSEGVVFSNLEEALMIRTLLHNALKENSAKKKNIEVKLDIEEGTRSFLVIDDISDHWDADLEFEVVECFLDGGANSWNTDAVGPEKGGLKMVVFLAGRKGNDIDLLDSSKVSPGKKAVRVVFREQGIADSLRDEQSMGASSSEGQPQNSGTPGTIEQPAACVLTS